VVFVEVEMMNILKKKKLGFFIFFMKMMNIDESCMKMKMREEDE